MGKSFNNNPLAFRAAGLTAGLALKQGIFSCHKLTNLRLVPAALAILVQCAAVITVFISVLVIGFFADIHFSTFSLVLIQALIATGFCIFVGMASWWRWIHFFFPLALCGMSLWQVPNEVYLVGFLVSLSLYWTTFRSQVPFYPSRPSVWRNVAELIPQDKPIRMIDIGSGLGDLSMHIAKTRPESQIEGIEIAPLPWLISKLRACLARSKAQFTLGDYHALDFAQYDVVFAYLSPAAMPALWQKAQQEMRAGSLLMSYEFEIMGVTPNFYVQGINQAPNIYVWKIAG